MTLLAENTTGMHNLFRLSSRASLEGYYFKPRMDRELLQRVPRGPHRDDGLPVGEVQTRLRLGQYDEAVQGGGRLPRHLRQGELLRRDHGPRPRHRAPDHERPAPPREGPRPAARRARTTCTTRTPHDATSHAALLCVQSGSTLERPEPLQVRRRRVLPEDRRRRCGTSSATTPRPATTRCSSPSAATSSSTPRPTTCRASRCPRARPRTPGSMKEVAKGLDVPVPGRHPRRGAQAGRLRGRRHQPDGLPRLLPRRRRLHQLVEEQRHPRRSGPRLRRRLDGRVRDAHHRPRPAPARPDLRAVPQPRPRLDARLRRRLRRPSPRRGDQVRHREVRRRARRADRHVRHDQGQAGAEGLLPRARLPVRHGREAHQGDAAARHGQGHPAHRASSTRTTRATRRPATSAPSSRPTPRRRPSSTPRSASRG